MRIKCPDCFAQFDVPDGAIKEHGRKLRCGQCKNEWHQLPVTVGTLNGLTVNSDETIEENPLETSDYEDYHRIN